MMKYAKYELQLKRSKVHESKVAYTATSSEDVYKFATKIMQLDRKPEENFCVITVSAKLDITGYYTVSTGTIDGSLVHPREVFKPAIVLNAAGIICLHNHPSGHCEPSNEDIKTTKRLKEAADILGIRMIDHVVIGDGCYTSFVRKGLM